MRSPDLIARNHGTVATVEVVTKAGRAWVDENVATEPWAWLGETFAVEPRLVGALLDGAREAGLEVAHA